jgi:hypothetical protein
MLQVFPAVFTLTKTVSVVMCQCSIFRI